MKVLGVSRHSVAFQKQPMTELIPGPVPQQVKATDSKCEVTGAQVLDSFLHALGSYPVTLLARNIGLNSVKSEAIWTETF